MSVVGLEYLEKYKPVDVSKELQAEFTSFSPKVVVLDDDPTGIQTVNGLYVYTTYDQETIEAAFNDGNTGFYILTNSRALSKKDTTDLHKKLIETIFTVAKKLGREFMIISRSDSTMRGHYPLETDVIAETLSLHGYKPDGEILVPFFKEGARLTFDNTHYVGDEINYTPCGQTEFAKDKSFGYNSSNMGEWIEEKSSGDYRKEDVIFITLDMLRNKDIDGVLSLLLESSAGSKFVVNAIDYCDIEVFSIALIQAYKVGKKFIFRSSASFPKVIMQVKDIPLLTKNVVADIEDANGGLIIVGSHVNKTTQQLESLLRLESLDTYEFDISCALDGEELQRRADKILKSCIDSISNSRTAVIYTSRKKIELPAEMSKDDILAVSVRISDAVSSIVKNLTVKPKFIVAKGGITSNDVGTKGLSVKRALILGQIQPGIPVWKLGVESKFDTMPYIIFPGNVGSVDALYEIVAELV